MAIGMETLPEIVRLTAGAAHQLAALLPRLVVNSGRMRANLELTNGLVFAEAVTFTLNEKMDRSSARSSLQKLAPSAVRALPLARDSFCELRSYRYSESTVARTAVRTGQLSGLRGSLHRHGPCCRDLTSSAEPPIRSTG
jgi:adenylosuccinate lyase